MPIQYRGSNLTGGDILYTRIPVGGPVSGTNYQLVSSADVDKLIAMGGNCFRLVFGWEAMQPLAMATLGSSSLAKCNEYFSRVTTLAKYITSKGAVCVLDIHGGADLDFAAYRGIKVGQVFNGYQVTDMLCDLWKQLATLFKDDQNIHFGITNEPCNLPTMTWFAAAQKVINAIRSTGATNQIWMPGAYFDGASSWNYTGSLYDTGNPKRSNQYGWENANGVGLPLTDSAGKLGVQVHLYYDPNYSGATTTIPRDTIGVESLIGICQWARTRGLKVLIGETGLSATSPLAQPTWQKTMDYLSANSDVFAGWLWWAYGPPAWWGNYQFALNAKADGTESAQLPIVAPSLNPPPTYQDLVDALAYAKDELKAAGVSLDAALAARDAAAKKLEMIQDVIDGHIV